MKWFCISEGESEGLRFIPMYTLLHVFWSSFFKIRVAEGGYLLFPLHQRPKNNLKNESGNWTGCGDCMKAFISSVLALCQCWLGYLILWNSSVTKQMQGMEHHNQLYLHCIPVKERNRYNEQLLCLWTALFRVAHCSIKYRTKPPPNLALSLTSEMLTEVIFLQPGTGRLILITSCLTPPEGACMYVLKCVVQGLVRYWHTKKKYSEAVSYFYL